MKVSFLVTYYNQKEYVRQSLDSILNIEKPCDWEILVGDDGSDDGTTEIVRQYMTQYPEHIFLYVMDREKDKKYEVVRRASANRLNLVDHMTGDFFCTLDGDDYYCNIEFLSRALDIFKEQPGVAIVGFGYQRFSEKAGVLSSHTLPAGPIETYAYLTSKMFTHAGACVMRNYMTTERKAYLNRIVYFDDNNIVMNNLHFGQLYAVDEVIYAYRQTDSSVYNSMQYAERAVLNAQSFDVDMLLLSGQEQALVERYGESLLQTRMLGKALKRLLGEEKWCRYCNGCQQLENSVTYVMLDASQSTPQAKQRIRRMMCHIIKTSPKKACLNILRSLKHRIVG